MFSYYHGSIVDQLISNFFVWNGNIVLSESPGSLCGVKTIFTGACLDSSSWQHTVTNDHHQENIILLQQQYLFCFSSVKLCEFASKVMSMMVVKIPDSRSLILRRVTLHCLAKTADAAYQKTTHIF